MYQLSWTSKTTEMSVPVANISFVSAGFYWSFRPYPASSFYSRLPWSCQCRGGHFSVGFPWKRKAAAREWVNISQHVTSHIVNAGYMLQLNLCELTPDEIKFIVSR